MYLLSDFDDTAEFRKPRKDKGRKRGPSLLGRTVAGRVARGVALAGAAGGAVIGAKALMARRGKGDGFVPKGDRVANPYSQGRGGFPRDVGVGRKAGAMRQRVDSALNNASVMVENAVRRARGLNRLPGR